MTELSGVDLARQALVVAREAAKKNGATGKNPKRRMGTARSYDATPASRSGSARREPVATAPRELDEMPL
ncbi:hypothetical protein [Streptomyces noursei]|uniref:hypothetical protein n=1 Tax=Streptomyces noursei TaxID=1971 RepID=UPI002155DF12|nr:hypothetical protein [Streptomyces noursei]